MVTVMDGPLAPWSAGMVERLNDLGYALRTAERHIELAKGLNQFLEQRHLCMDELDEAVVERFLAQRRRRARRTPKHPPTLQSLGWLLDYLREHGAIPARISPLPGSAAEELLERYRTFLIVERGLTAETALTYQRPVRRFLDELSEELGQVGPAEVSRFMTRHAQRRGQAYAERAATALRSFLGFALVEGLITAPLADTVPSAANWAGSSLPRGLAPGELAALLASCDRRRATGRRNYAILVVLGRLGLRAVEVANLRLEDIDWRAGEIVVQGKGSAERLPLPPDVGAAIASYVRRGRQHCADRAVFLRAIAPVRGLSPDGVGEVVRAASERAGLGSFGSHRLRHTAATEMLRAGASMSEVAQVLRHRRVLTTAIYAKVDHRSLVELARPWPEILR